MLSICPIKPYKQSYFIQNNAQQRVVSPFAKPGDTISFGCKHTIGRCPECLKHINIATLNRESKNVLEVNDIGFLAEIIKYKDPKSSKIYAIKRNWAKEKAKNVNTDAIAQMKIEASVYKKLGKIGNIPHFHFYNGFFSKEPNSPLQNYLIMSWQDGKIASKRGIVYDFDLVNKKTLEKTYQILNKFDEKGVIHNDLWAGNILFSKDNVNIIDFNRSYFFNSEKNYHQNNLDSFKERFLNRYLSDLYNRKGEDALLKTYSDTLKMDLQYYQKRLNFYKKNQNGTGSRYYASLITNIKNELHQPRTMRENAISTVFRSDNRCGNIFAKHFEFKDDEAVFHFKKALKTLQNNPEIINESYSQNLKTKIKIISSMKNIIESKDKTNNKAFSDILNTLDDKHFAKEESGKPYYSLFKRFCELNLKLNYPQTAQSKDLILKEYADIIKIKNLQSYFASGSTV